jgi:hypothetical protein
VLRSSILVSTVSTALAFDDAAKLAYDLQWALVGDFMKQGVSAIIIDSTCNYQTVLDQGLSLAAEHGYCYWYVECRVSAGDVDLLDKRLRARTTIPSQRSAIDGPPAAAQRQWCSRALCTVDLVPLPPYRWPCYHAGFDCQAGDAAGRDPGADRGGVSQARDVDDSIIFTCCSLS